MSGSDLTTDALEKKGLGAPRRLRCKSCPTVAKVEVGEPAALVNHSYLYMISANYTSRAVDVTLVSNLPSACIKYLVVRRVACEG